MKFKPSTHRQIEQRVKEVLYPQVEAGKTYYFSQYKDSKEVVERPVVSVDDKHVIYLRNGKEIKCQLNTFRRMLSVHRVTPNESLT